MQKKENMTLSEGAIYELHDAFLYIEDLLHRSMMPFIVLDTIAKDLHENRMVLNKGSKIEIAVLKKHATKECLSTLRGLLKDFEESKDKIVTKHGEVPINIKIIKLKYGFFKNPDVRNYWHDQVYIPNPFDIYWGVRGLI